MVIIMYKSIKIFRIITNLFITISICNIHLFSFFSLLLCGYDILPSSPPPISLLFSTSALTAWISLCIWQTQKPLNHQFCTFERYGYAFCKEKRLFAQRRNFQEVSNVPREQIEKENHWLQSNFVNCVILISCNYCFGSKLPLCLIEPYWRVCLCIFWRLKLKYWNFYCICAQAKWDCWIAGLDTN